MSATFTTQTEHRAKSLQSRQLEVVGIKTLTNSYQTVVEWDVGCWLNQKLITIKNTHATNGLKYSIFASADDSPESTDWYTLVGTGGDTAEQTVNAGVVDYQTSADAWRWIRVQCKNAVDNNQASTKVVLRSVMAEI